MSSENWKAQMAKYGLKNFPVSRLDDQQPTCNAKALFCSQSLSWYVVFSHFGEKLKNRSNSFTCRFNSSSCWRLSTIARTTTALKGETEDEKEVSCHCKSIVIHDFFYAFEDERAQEEEYHYCISSFVICDPLFIYFPMFLTCTAMLRARFSES